MSQANQQQNRRNPSGNDNTTNVNLNIINAPMANPTASTSQTTSAAHPLQTIGGNNSGAGGPSAQQTTQQPSNNTQVPFDISTGTLQLYTIDHGPLPVIFPTFGLELLTFLDYLVDSRLNTTCTSSREMQWLEDMDLMEHSLITFFIIYPRLCVMNL